MHAPDLDRNVEKGRTTTASAFTTLPREQAFAEIRDSEDRRPLLVLRECDLCKGSDAALLSRKLDNETTVLLTHWFRCVKLPNDVLTENHPFRSLFPDEHPPHLFLCDRFGKEVIDLDGNQSQKLLWESMYQTLKGHYRGSAKQNVKEIRKLLNEFDFLDTRDNDARTRLDNMVLKYGPKSSKVKRLRKMIEKLEKERTKLTERKDELLALELIEQPETVGAR